jgi:transposase
MELTREQKRLLMLHEYKLGTKAAKAAEKINQAWGNNTVGESTVYERYREFKTGNEDLDHKQGAGRPKEIDRDAILEAIEENPSLTCRMLAYDFNCCPKTISNVLRELGKS